MTLSGSAEILRRHMQIDLGAGDLPMPQQISDRHKVDAGAHEMRGEGVAEPVGTERFGETRATTDRAHALVDRAARHGLAGARAEERRGGQLGAANLHLLAKAEGALLAEKHSALIAPFSPHP